MRTSLKATKETIWLLHLVFNLKIALRFSISMCRVSMQFKNNQPIPLSLYFSFSTYISNAWIIDYCISLPRHILAVPWKVLSISLPPCSRQEFVPHYSKGVSDLAPTPHPTICFLGPPLAPRVMSWILQKRDVRLIGEYKSLWDGTIVKDKGWKQN